jgi:folate-binding protein YgfZ
MNPAHYDYGDPDAEYRALTDGAGLVDRSSNSRIEHAGADALDLLHRLTTNDLLDLVDGQARGTIVTNGDARIIDVLTVVRRPSRPLLLLGSEGRADAVLAWLDQYTFGEDSTPRDISGETVEFTLIGPRAEAVLRSAAGVPLSLEPWRYSVAEFGGQHVEVVRTASPAVDGYEVIVTASGSSQVKGALAEAGAAPAGVRAFDAYRVAHCVPAYGRELDEHVNPHEANLLPFVSFTKGCYIGQEVVARLDTYDKVQRRLVRVVARSSVSSLESGTLLMVDGQRVGELRTVARAGPVTGHEALAFVRRGFWEQGARSADRHGRELRVESTEATAP